MVDEFVVCNKSDLVSVANAIRTKSGTSGDMNFPQDFVDGVSGIEAGGGGMNIDTCTVTINNQSSLRLIFEFVILGNNGIEISYNQGVNMGATKTVNNVVCNTLAAIDYAFGDLAELYIDVDGTTVNADGSTYPIAIEGVAGGTVVITIQ